MKRKIILLAAALMLFMGVVNASSINGDYKGNPIVKVMSNGKQLQSDEVPAMIYDGHTVVPISLLRQIGASVEWNQEAYSVDVKLPQNTNQVTQTRSTTPDIDEIIKKIGFKGEKLIYHAEYFSIGEGTGQLSFGLTFDADDPTKGAALNTIFNIAANSNAMQLKYEDSKYETFIFINDIKNFLSGTLTTKEFADKMTVKRKVPYPSSSIVPTTETETTNTNAIETTIDGEFTGWAGETIFKLSNGQIWQQDSFAYTYSYAFMPKVLIYKDGTRYKLKVEGIKETIDVKQIK